MDFTAKRRIDHLLGMTLLFPISILARLLGLLLRRNHATEPAEIILIMKFQGVGSLVTARSALIRLRQERPNSTIIFWGTPATCSLAAIIPVFDKILCLEDRTLFSAFKTLLHGLYVLWRKKIDWAFDLEVYSKLSSVILTLTCARNRAGFAVPSAKLRAHIHTHIVMYNRYFFLGQCYLTLLGLAAETYDARAPALDLPWSFTPVRPAGLSHRYAVINAFCGELAPERKWPVENFPRLIAELRKAEPALQIVLVGQGSIEHGEAERMVSDSNVINLVNQLSLPELVQCVRYADLVISIDSLVMHLAAAEQRPLVALFGPTLAQSYLPLADVNTIAISAGLYCTPCVHHWDKAPCTGNNQCMRIISVDEVLRACLLLLRGTGRAERSWHPLALSPPAPDFYPGLVYTRMHPRNRS